MGVWRVSFVMSSERSAGSRARLRAGASRRSSRPGPAFGHTVGMTAQLNHTIVHARDSAASARFLAEILGLEPPTRFGPFSVVHTGNGVSLDFIDAGDFEFIPEHYAFLITEAEFDVIFGRIHERGLAYSGRPREGKPRRDQPPLRRAGRLLRGSRRSLPRDHHPAVRQRVGRRSQTVWSLLPGRPTPPDPGAIGFRS